MSSNKTRNIKLVIEYDGTNYCGWQKQKKQRTIEGEILSAWQKLAQEKIKLISAGRTDAGVHALAQVANFLTGTRLNCEKIQKALNSILPEDIVIHKVVEVDPQWNARYRAIKRHYRYTIYNNSIPPAIYRNLVFHYRGKLSVPDMVEASKKLIGEHNFSSFRLSSCQAKNPVRVVDKINIVRSGVYIFFDIVANAFLQGMVRAMVGTLLAVGRGKLAVETVEQILLAKDRRLAGVSLPARGLTLVKIVYPEGGLEAPINSVAYNVEKQDA